MDVILDLFARKQKQHTHAGNLFVVGSLDKQMQNEKELIRLAAGVLWEWGGEFSISVKIIHLTPDLTGQEK